MGYGSAFGNAIYHNYPGPDYDDMMAAVNATLEGWIRERPEQWFWLHRRWPD